MRLTELKCYDDDPLYRELNEMGLYCSDSFWIGICITFKYWCLNPLGEWRHASEVADAINKLHQEGKTDVFIDDKDSFSRGLNHIICISLSVLPIR